MENFSRCSTDFHPSCSSDHSSSIGSGILDEDAYATVATSSPKKRAGRKKFRETRHPLYKGVRRRNGDKWVCEVREPKKKTRIWLGTFPTADMAARAHDVAAMALKGRRACLNFADSAWRLPAPASCRTTDIQKAAREAAESFRLSAEDDSSSSEVCQRKPENEAISPECLFGMDEEAAFGMPGLLASMAEGMLLSPPPCSGSGSLWDGAELEVDMCLWSYSI